MQWGLWVGAGPRLFAVPGDTLEVVFRNNLNTSTNIVPSGVVTNTTSAADPGQTVYYEWTVGQQVCSVPAETHAFREDQMGPLQPMHACVKIHLQTISLR